MRLLNTSNVSEFEEFIGDVTRPQYAILSHTWERGEEVSFQEFGNPTKCAHKKGYGKIIQACAVAASHGFSHVWVDTCCINKESSAELSEAINSMFRWYRDAAVCYVYLDNLPPVGPDPESETEFASSFAACKWFTRGWTLQELIASREVLFFDKEWNQRGTKADLCELLSSITRIPQNLLRHEARLSEFAVAQKMSWASGRKTTRPEDEAYCLLGLFEVHMTLLYGEGRAAFSRLQKLVLETTGDLSIFAWTDDDKSESEYSGFFARSPRQFHGCSQIQINQEDIGMYRDPAFTTRGVRLEASMVHLYAEEGDSSHDHQPVLTLHCTEGNACVGVYLRKIGGRRYARWNPRHTARFEAINTWKRRLSSLERYGRTMPTPPERLPRATALPIETLFLPLTLDPSSVNPVLSNRRTGLQMVFDTDLNSGLEYWGLFPMPRSHWDRHDQVFFSTNKLNKSWCAAFVEWQRGTDVLRMFVACFYWNYKRETVTMLGVFDGMDERAIFSLRHALGQVEFENTRGAEDLIHGAIRGDRLCTQPPLAVFVGEAEVSVGWELRQEERPDICVNPVTVLKVSIALPGRPDCVR